LANLWGEKKKKQIKINFKSSDVPIKLIKSNSKLQLKIPNSLKFAVNLNCKKYKFSRYVCRVERLTKRLI